MNLWIYFAITFLSGLTTPAVTFVIDKDTVNFTDTSQSIELINSSNTTISIDTIKLFKTSNSYSGFISSLVFDTAETINYSEYGTFHAPYIYKVNSPSLPADALITDGKGLSIGKRNYLKLNSGYFSTSRVGKIAQSYLDRRKDTLNFLFISSNRQKDSVCVILYAFLFGTKTLNYPVSMKSTPNKLTNTYLLNGRIINNKALLRERSKIIIKR